MLSSFELLFIAASFIFMVLLAAGGSVNPAGQPGRLVPQLLAGVILLTLLSAFLLGALRHGASALVTIIGLLCALLAGDLTLAFLQLRRYDRFGHLDRLHWRLWRALLLLWTLLGMSVVAGCVWTRVSLIGLACLPIPILSAHRKLVRCRKLVERRNAAA